MSFKFFANRSFVSKLFSFLAVAIFLQTSHLTAANWGRHGGDKTEYEGETWEEIYCDVDNIFLVAHIPNYVGGYTENKNGLEITSVVGIEGEIWYTISIYHTRIPRSLDEFIKNVQTANPKDIVTAIDSTKLGTKYAVDTVPAEPAVSVFARILYTADPSVSVFTRILYTEGHIIHISSNDTNDKRRLHFFESIHVR